MKFNTWVLIITPTNGDFESISDSGWTGPRKPDGSLPDIPFLKLKTGSKLIDKGTDVGLPFSGDAPDLGAYKFGASTAAIVQPFLAEPGVGATSRRGYAISEFHLFDLVGRRTKIDAAETGLKILIHKSAEGEPRPRLFIVFGFHGGRNRRSTTKRR